MRELFSMVPNFKNMKLSLSANLQKLSEYKQDTNEEYMESISFGSFELSDIPPSVTNNFHSSTENGALNYEQQILNEKKEMRKAHKDICREIYFIEVILDKIEIGLNALPKHRQEILQMKYWESYTWNEVVESLKKSDIFYSKKRIQEFAKKDMAKLNMIALIDMKMYENVLALINID